LLQVSIKRTEQSLSKFESRFGLLTTEFIQRFENDELAETLDYVEWVGEYRLKVIASWLNGATHDQANGAILGLRQGPSLGIFTSFRKGVFRYY